MNTAPKKTYRLSKACFLYKCALAQMTFRFGVVLDCDVNCSFFRHTKAFQGNPLGLIIRRNDPSEPKLPSGTQKQGASWCRKRTLDYALAVQACHDRAGAGFRMLTGQIIDEFMLFDGSAVAIDYRSNPK